MPDPYLPPSREPELPPLDLRILSGPAPGPRDLRYWLLGIVVVFILSMLAAPYLREEPGDRPPASSEEPPVPQE